MALLTVDEYKSIRHIGGNSEDAWIEALIPLVEEEYLRIRNAELEPEGEWPKGAKLVACDMIDYRMEELKKRGVTSESIGDYSVSYANEETEDYPSYIRKRIRRHGRLR